MCTVTFIPRSDGFYFAMNRDERVARASASPPAIFEQGRVASIYPLDCEGGTWIAANSMGVAFALLNWNDALVLRKKRLTRGRVIPALLSSTCSRAAESELGRFDLDGILPFRLIGIFPAEKSVIAWRWDQKSVEGRTLPWTMKQWCSSSLSDVTAASARTRVFEEKLRECHGVSLTWLRQLHSSHDDSHLPFSYCVHREAVETVSYTEFVCTGEGIKCNYFAGSPCEADMSGQGVSLGFKRTPARSSVLLVNKPQQSSVSPRT